MEVQSFQLSDLVFIFRGFGVTLLLCISSMILGGIVGIIIGLLRASKFKIVKAITYVYVYIIRGTPLLMQLFLIYYRLPLITGYSIDSNVVAIGGLTLYTRAFLAEIVRAGIEGVDVGQGEAAKSLGMNFFQEYRYIILPQAFKIIIPPGFGFLIALIKDSSLVSAIGFVELARAGKLIVARTFQPFTIYAIIAVLYFIMCYSLSLVSKRLQKES